MDPHYTRFRLSPRANARILLCGVVVALAFQQIRGQLCAQQVAPKPQRRALSMPAQVGQYARSDSTMRGDTVWLSYDGQGAARLNAFIVTLPPLVNNRQEAESFLRSRVRSFTTTLDEGVTRGWYDDYQVAFESEKNLPIGTDTVVGHVFAFTFSSQDRTYVSLFHAYVVCRKWLGIRVTIPEPGWEENNALGFPKQFVSQLRSTCR